MSRRQLSNQEIISLCIGGLKFRMIKNSRLFTYVIEMEYYTAYYRIMQQ